MNGISTIHAKLMSLQDDAEHIAIVNLDEADCTDPERAHSTADEVLLTFIKDAGFEEVAQAYERLVSRCGWWGAG